MLDFYYVTLKFHFLVVENSVEVVENLDTTVFFENAKKEKVAFFKLFCSKTAVNKIICLPLVNGVWETNYFLKGGSQKSAAPKYQPVTPSFFAR